MSHSVLLLHVALVCRINARACTVVLGLIGHRCMHVDETLKRPTLPAELQLVQTAVAGVRKAMTMMLKGLGNDLLYSAAHGSGLRRCFALILASSGMRIITPVAMMPANKASVRRHSPTDHLA